MPAVTKIPGHPAQELTVINGPFIDSGGEPKAGSDVPYWERQLALAPCILWGPH